MIQQTSGCQALYKFHDLSYDYKDLIAGIGAKQSMIYNIKNSYTQATKVLDLIDYSHPIEPVVPSF
ncbi:hypothetical protein [Terrilactibacillus laevilacticus]|uniref:hypothetical protein n=1 Tax=Terrilactibacillus laevilacticus TaxID=1380157 RepID=UPI00114770F0|nr:hypothetical protein [Terrilactibacillus laevilacticus]